MMDYVATRCCYHDSSVGRRDPDTHVSFADVVGVFVDVPGQAEVTDFDHVVVGEQNVSGRQISVDAL